MPTAIVMTLAAMQAPTAVVAAPVPAPPAAKPGSMQARFDAANVALGAGRVQEAHDGFDAIMAAPIKRPALVAGTIQARRARALMALDRPVEARIAADAAVALLGERAEARDDEAARKYLAYTGSGTGRNTR